MTRTKKRCKNCYNKEDKTCCNRTWGSWVKILLYYIVFLCVIIGMLLIGIFNIARKYREHPNEPPIRKILFVGDDGPGATFVPHSKNSPESVIWFYPNSTNRLGIDGYIHAINQTVAEQKYRCHSIQQTVGRPCRFNTTEFGPCGSSPYGYEESKPCIFLKLNKIPTWSPERYGSDSQLPKGIDDSVKMVIDVTRDVVYVHCEGFRPHDSEKIGRIKYYPEPMFSEKYFPLPKDISTNPIIAMQLENIRRMQVASR